MLDTISIVSEQDNYRFPIAKAQYVIDYHDTNKKYLLTQTYINENYRVFHDLNRNAVRIEASIPKIIFGHNGLNYIEPKNHNLIKLYIDLFAKFFFKDTSTVYINRIDIASVQYFDNPAKQIETYKQFKLQNQRLTKFNHQNYKSSVFYFSKNFSTKIYDKFIESKDESHRGLLRFEKSYRLGYLKKCKMLAKPYFGVSLSALKIEVLINDFLETFQKWTSKTVVANPTRNGLMGTLETLRVENIQLLQELVIKGIISDSTIKRLNRIPENYYLQKDFTIDVKLNLEDNLKRTTFESLKNFNYLLTTKF